MKQASRDIKEQLIFAVEQIEDGVRLFNDGRRSAYQIVAVQLRKLLLNPRRSPLLQVLPDATFHTFADPAPRKPHAAMPEGLTPVVLMARVSLRMSQHQAPRYTLKFDEEAPTMPPSRWIEEWVVRPPQLGQPGFVIRQLIAESANEEGAHTQSEVGPTLSRMNGFAVFGDSTYNEHELAIVAIGEYVANRIRVLLNISA